MRSRCEDFLSSTTTEKNVSCTLEGRNASNSTNNDAIPYHARENSLPFSYGQINQTSTPLKNGRVGKSSSSSLCYSTGYDNDSQICVKDINLSLNSGVGKDINKIGNNSGAKFSSTTDSMDNNSMIKAQPRLTSPLLVRKTLNNRSPTRGSANTIANTYHYNYGDSSLIDLNKTSTLNSNNNDKLYCSDNKTSTRNNFEQLLLARRENIYNEYRSGTQELLTNTSPASKCYKKQPPKPPQRQLSSHFATAASNGHGQQLGQTSIGSRNLQQNNKYNFDIEFNLNLDSEWNVPQYCENNYNSNYIKNTAVSNYNYNNNNNNNINNINIAKRLSTHTLNIDVDDGPISLKDSESTNVKRHYHTISSAFTSRERPPFITTTDKTSGVTATATATAATYDGRRSHPQPVRQDLQQSSEYIAFGNGNASGYSNNNITSSGYDSKPIYSIATKQVLTSARSINEQIQTPDLPITDYATALTVTPTMASQSLMSAPKTTTMLSARPETPAFPVTPRTPHAYGSNVGHNSPSEQSQSLAIHRQEFTNSQLTDVHNYSSETIYQTLNNRTRLQSNVSANSELQEVAAHLVKFAKDSSKFWYKANLTREEAIMLLLNAEPGTFVVRDSTTYKNAYGLVLRVPQTPPYATSGKPDELVRHFLIEPTTRGVRLKGCANEPVFTSLSAFVYEHSINKLGLPCLLRIPEQDLVPPLQEPTPAQKQLMTQGAACNVLWLFSCETESLTGEEAIRKAIRQLYTLKSQPTPTEVHFKVSQHGITLTDNTRRKFFRKHYNADIISYCAIDPDHRLWTLQPLEAPEENKTTQGTLKKTIFAFVARRSSSSKDNQCHVFCDLDIHQPASAIVSFANRTLPTVKQRNIVL